MKKFFLSLFTLLMLGSSLAWADGTVKGMVSVAGQSNGFCNGAVVTLSNDEKQFSVTADQDWDAYPDDHMYYKFENIPEGTYTLTARHIPLGSTGLYEAEETVTVSSGILTQDLVLSLVEGTYCKLTVRAGVFVKYNSMGNAVYDYIVGAQIFCGEKGSDKTEKGTQATKYDAVTFFCKANTEYELVVKASGYKTAKETLSLTEATDKTVEMEEGEDETEAGNAQLTGTAIVEGGGAWPSGVYIALTDASDNILNVVSDLSGGTYSFANVKLGSAVKFHLTTDLTNPFSHPEDYTFVEGGSEINPVSFTMPNDAGTEAVVTKNLTIRYKGNATATLVGRVLDNNGGCLKTSVVSVAISGNGADKTTTARQNVQVAYEQGWDNNCGSIYQFTNIAAGTYTLTYSGENYITQSQTYTVVITGPGQTVVAPDLTLQAEQVTLTLEANNTAWGSVSGNGTFDKGTSVTVTATANEGYEFQAWKEGETQVSTEAEYTFTITADRTLTAVFAEKAPEVETVTLALSASPAAGGTVTESGDGTYEKGASVTVTATANEGYEFQAWKEGETQVSTEAEYTFTITADRTLTAVFVEETPVVETVTLALSASPAEGGTVTESGDGTYEKGASVTVTATANAGYRFVAWQENGADIDAAGAEYTFTIEANRALVAVFESTTVKLTLNVNNETMGSVSQSGDGTYEKGASVTVTATPNEGYEFSGWRKSGETVSTDNPYTFTINENTTLTARFTAPGVVHDSSTITLEVNDPAMGTVTGGGKHEVGEHIDIKAIPNEGYRFVEWQENDARLSDENPYTVAIEANTDRTIKAVFAEITPVVETVTLTLSASPAEGGSVSQSGNGTYEKGTSVTVTAVANAGYEFKGWQENNATVDAAGAEYTFTIEANRELTALFAEKQTPPVEEKVTLTLKASNDEWGTVEGANIYDKGTKVTAKAIANEGYKFRAWTEGEEVVSTDAEYEFTIEANRTLTAVFVEETPVVEKVTLTLEVNDAAMGTVEGAGTYDKGVGVTVKATPNKGYVFQAWKNGGETVATTAEYTFTLMEDLTLTAVFVPGDANEALEQAAWRVYAEGRAIVLCHETPCRYEVYTISGKQVAQGGANGQEIRIAVSHSGLYVVRCITANGITTKKVAVR